MRSDDLGGPGLFEDVEWLKDILLWTSETDFLMLRGLVQSPCEKINVIMTLGGGGLGP